ncbi:hypothetical protein ILUMI_12486 [Ignelater luminosus]|uniref:Protein sleepless n=1 Tax=Ignelater luminosus TaxID=2038154 RepID=A0A8K0GCW6_IGNLU|nr:hypothetical protein ILUMI_12486 [Ignelater luminosus]
MFYFKVLFLCCLISFLQTSTATTVSRCYHCSSSKAGSCGDTFNPATTPTITCINRYCNARTLKDSHTDLVIRGCVDFADLCDDPAFYPCKTCSEDLCNYASHPAPYFSVLMISSVLAYIVKLIV